MKELELNQISEENQREELLSALCKDDEIDISISYISDFKNAKILREFVDELCKRYNVHPKWRTRLVLVIDELNNNAIEYGSKAWDTNYLTLQILKDWSENVEIAASVIDTGTWAHAKTAQDMLELRKKHENKDFTKHNSIRGRWLFLIISRLVDTLYFEDDRRGGLVVGIKKVLK